MSTESNRIDVVIGVIVNPRNEVLVTQRHNNAHQGGLWEFPGGKREADEDIIDTLARELKEEIGITVVDASRLIEINYDYDDRIVNLKVFTIDVFEGIARSCEGQTIQWVPIISLHEVAMPAANAGIVQAITLPDTYLITPEPEDLESFLTTLQNCLLGGIRLIQYRDKSATDSQYAQRLDTIKELAHQSGAKVLINRSIEMFTQVNADGLHLTADQLLALEDRPVANECLLSASCHNLDEVEQANKIGADFIMLSPVLPTLTHPGAPTLGWEKTKQLIQRAHMPVYALGGMEPGHIPLARVNGAQGIAGIRSLWKGFQ